MENDPIKQMLRLARWLFLLNAAVWMVFAVLGFVRAGAGAGNWRLVQSMLMLVNAVVMAWFGLQIDNGRAWVFFLAITYLALNVVLSITDQFGWFDALILLLNLALLGLLFVTRQRMIQATRNSRVVDKHSP